MPLNATCPARGRVVAQRRGLLGISESCVYRGENVAGGRWRVRMRLRALSGLCLSLEQSAVKCGTIAFVRGIWTGTGQGSLVCASALTHSHAPRSALLLLRATVLVQSYKYEYCIVPVYSYSREQQPLMQRGLLLAHAFKFTNKAPCTLLYCPFRLLHLHMGYMPICSLAYC